ncbi:MAG: BspA family leucine-rich repeat surface protein, partial [Coriobacteriia bacterium]|nr:BspA family leucine-rich repeat surface protein [Coriobacteriia bacterium]
MLRGIHVGRATVSMMLAISIAIAAAAIWPNQSLAAEVESSSEGFGSSFQVEDADIDSGVYDGVDWRITTNNELLIGNAGDVQEFEYKQDRDAEDYPWNPYREQITSVRFMGTVRGNGSARTMFARCESLTNLDLSSFDTSGITDMSGMFANCTNITALDLSPLNTANATNMSGLLSWCTHLTTLDLSSFDTNNVTDMSSMFYHCENLASLDLSSFDTSNVVNLRFCFADCHNLDTLDLSNFDTANVHDMFAMFTRCRSLTALDLSSFDDSNVYNMESCFQDCSTLTAIDLSSFKTENVTDMSSMFNGCYALEEADLSTFDTGKVEDMRAMFKNCYELRTIFASSDWQPYYDAQMFVSCDSLIGGNGTKYNSEHTDSEYARIDGKEGLPGYFTEKGAPGKPSRLTDVEVKFKATIPDAEVDTKVDWDD